MRQKLCKFATLAITMALLLSAAQSHAAPVRVTTWNLLPSAIAGTNTFSPTSQSNLIQEAANALKKINPDVILLQQVADWESCNQLAKSLQPENYSVVVCSSFRDARTKMMSRHQVAILSKVKAYLSWSEPWQNSAQSVAAPGGFAFAAIHLGDKNAGFFSVQLSDGSTLVLDADASAAREESSRQLVRQIAALRNWTVNRLQSLVVAGDFNTSTDDPKLTREQTLPRLEQSGFENAFANLPLAQRATLPASGQRPAATVDYIFTRDIGQVSVPQLFQPALFEHRAVTCDLDLNATKLAPAVPPVARAELPPTKAEASQTKLAAVLAKTPAPAPANHSQTVWWLAGFLAVSLVIFTVVQLLKQRLRRQHIKAALLTAKAENGVSFSISNAERIAIARPSGTPIGHSTNALYPLLHTQGATQTRSQPSSPRNGQLEIPAEQLPDSVRAGVMANLSRWLREKLVRQLVVDRAHLLATQKTAALQVLAVDERLSKIEREIQRRNQEYEQRIDALLKELVTAKEENRELIQLKINMVQAEMEKERLKAEQAAKEHRQN